MGANTFVGCVYFVCTVYAALLCTFTKSDARMLHAKHELAEMNKNLEHIPAGSFDITILNLAHNCIPELAPLVFWNNSYKSVKKLILQHNRIGNVSLTAFRGLSELKTVDLSDNKITQIDPYTFQQNAKLDKVILFNNHIKFDRVQPFLTSHSIDTLILTNNRITHVYEATFLGLPNLKRLFLNENDLNYLAPYSFGRLPKLNYLSLSFTLVYQMSEGMFEKLPRIIDLEGTPISETFSPPLGQVNETSARKLFAALRRSQF